MTIHAPAPHDAVNTPAHYQSGGTLQVIDVIEAWGLGFHLGNAVKYILRAGRKGDRAEDLAKACRYLSRAAETPELAVFPSTFVADPEGLRWETVAVAFGANFDCTYALRNIFKACTSPNGPKAARHLRDAKAVLERELGYAIDDWRLRS